IDGFRAAVLANGLIDDPEIALADLLLDCKVTQLAARRELLLTEQRDDVADPGIDLLPRMKDDVDQCVDAVTVEAALCEGKCEAALRALATNIVGCQPQQAFTHLGHFVEREEALELTAHNVDRRVHLLLVLASRIARPSQVALRERKPRELSG